jgi:hypothetical protein
MADIFDEVSEDLRQEKIAQIWKKFSKSIISFIVFVIIFISAYQGYISWKKNQLNSQAEFFFNALNNLENNNILKSKDFFIKNTSGKGDGYEMLSIFGLAETNFKDNKIEIMIQNYQSIYENTSFDNHYRYLARLLSVIRDKNSPYIKLHDRLKPILNSPSKLQTLAAELEIILLVRFNMIKKAKLLLTKLLKRNEISVEQKNRLTLINKLYE